MADQDPAPKATDEPKPDREPRSEPVKVRVMRPNPSAESTFEIERRVIKRFRRGSDG
jgi:hypothetical protein